MSQECQTHTTGEGRSTVFLHLLLSHMASAPHLLGTCLRLPNPPPPPLIIIIIIIMIIIITITTPVLQASLDTNSAENKITVLSTFKNMKLAKLHTTKK